MKKLIAVIAALALAVCAVATASAETVKPNPATIDINNLENLYVTTDIALKDDNTMTLTLYEPERFAPEAIAAVKVGDTIVTDGEEVAITSIDRDGPDYVFNQGTETEMLFCDGGKYFEHSMENDNVPWIKIGSMDKEILEYYPILDWVDPKTGECYDEVVVYRGDKLKELLKDPEGASFDVKNVHVLYDGNNEIQLIWRFYSPLQ